MQMKNNYIVGLVSSIAIIGLIGVAEAQQTGNVSSLPQQGKWSVAPNIGTEVNVGGTFIQGASDTLNLNGTVFGNALVFNGTATVDKQNFDDVYSKPVVAGMGFNYGVSNNSEVFGNLSYTRANGKEFDAINVTASGIYAGTAFAAGATVRGKLDDYSAIGGEVGYRHFFDTGNGFHPFVSGAVGLKHVSSIGGTLSVSGISGKGAFFDSSWTPTAGLGGGFRYDVSPGVALGFEIGIRYEGDLSANDNDISATGNLANANNAGNRLEVPLKVGLNITF
jgi:hypothetical protein